MANPRFIYASRRDEAPETEADALANAFRFILDCRAKKKNVEPAPEPDVRNTRGKSDGSRATRIISD